MTIRPRVACSREFLRWKRSTPTIWSVFLKIWANDKWRSTKTHQKPRTSFRVSSWIVNVFELTTLETLSVISFKVGRHHAFDVDSFSSVPEQISNNSAQRPTVCRNCGSIVGGGEATCAVCGAATGADLARKRPPAPGREHH